MSVILGNYEFAVWSQRVELKNGNPNFTMVYSSLQPRDVQKYPCQSCIIVVKPPAPKRLSLIGPKKDDATMEGCPNNACELRIRMDPWSFKCLINPHYKLKQCLLELRIVTAKASSTFCR